MAQVQRKRVSEPETGPLGNEEPIEAPKLTLADFSQRPEDETLLQRVLPPIVAVSILGALIYFAGLLATLITVGIIFVGLIIFFWNLPPD